METHLKERGIIFSSPMVRALLAGKKTQTRRIVGSARDADNGELVDVPDDGLALWTDPATGYPREAKDPNWLWRPANAIDCSCEDGGPFWKCPYGSPGDRLWVRETWARHYSGMEGCRPHYRADLPEEKDAAMTANHAFGLMKWKPSIHMPRRLSRIDLEITEVRVERLNAISEEDAEAEGIPYIDNGRGILQWSAAGKWYVYVQDAYKGLWNSINGKGSWDANPWVWCISFVVLREAVTP